MSTAPSLRIFGFPVDIRPGFVMLLALFVFLNPGEVGLWLAACVGIFTLIHELGHAFAARATGADRRAGGCPRPGGAVAVFSAE